jgi:hypothetical protein
MPDPAGYMGYGSGKSVPVPGWFDPLFRIFVITSAVPEELS